MASTGFTHYYRELCPVVAKQVNGIIHVGANSAEEMPFYNELPGPKLYFEPIPEIAERIVTKISKLQDPKYPSYVEVLGCGSENMKDVTLHVSANGGNSSSILDGVNGLHFSKYGIATIKDISIEVVRLDSYMKTHIPKNSYSFEQFPYNVLCIDTEGYDLEVLKGATETLKHIKFLMVECWEDEYFIGCPTFEEQNKFIIDQGFTLVKSDIFNKRFGNHFYTKL